MLITFSGLDGAGKSTLIAWLKQELERQNRHVAIFHMNEDVGIYAYLRSCRNRMRRAAGRTGQRIEAEHACSEVTDAPGGQADGRNVLMRAIRTMRYGVVWNRPLRRGIYLIDLLIFMLYRFYIETLKKQILIMDRYFYDTLVDVADDGRWFWVRFLSRLTPTPSVPVFLDISPEESYARKGEYSVEYLQRRWVAYRAVFQGVSSAVVVANSDLDATMRLLETAVKERWMAGCARAQKKNMPI